MVNQLDTSALDPGSFKSLRDNQVEQTLENQKINAGNVSNASAAQLYATQVLSGAVASNDQGIYDSAKNHLAQMGVDVSGLAPDLATGAQQVQAVRNSIYNANPLNALLGLGLKAEGVQQQAVGNMGSQSAGDAAVPLASQLAARLSGGAMPGLSGAPAQTAPMPAAAPGTGAIAPSLPAQASDALPVTPAATPRPAGSLDPNAVIAPTAAAASAPVSGIMAPPKRSDAKYNQPGVTEAANNALYSADLDAWKQTPAVQQAQATASASGGAAGKDVGAMPKEVASAQEMSERIGKNLDAMLAVNPDVPVEKWGIPASAKAWLSQNFPNAPVEDGGKSALAYNAFTKINKAQIVNGLQELVNSGSIRNSRPLIQLIADVNGIDENASVESRAQQINAVRAEIQNLATSTANINSDLTGGQRQPYQAVPIPQSGSTNWTFQNGKLVPSK